MTIAVPPVWRRIADIAATLAWSVPLAFALAALSGSGHRWPDLLAQFVVPVTVAAAGYAVVVMLLRLRLASWTSLPVLSLLLVAAAPQASVSTEGTGPIVRVYSANLHVWNRDVQAVRRSIQASRADIIVLVELGGGLAPSIDTLLADYPHRSVSGITQPDPHGVRTLVASRWPLSAIPSESQQYQGQGAVVATPLGPLRVVGAHLTRPWPYQYQWGQLFQARAITEELGGRSQRLVLAGDFNSVSSGRVGRQIQRELNLHPAKGLIGTWPSDLPAWLGVTIDQVWASPDLVFVSRRIGLDNGSDHRPVVTELRRVRP